MSCASCAYRGSTRSSQAGREALFAKREAYHARSGRRRPFARAPWGFARRPAGSPSAWQLDLDHQPVRLGRARPYRAAVSLDDLAHDRQPEPRAAQALVRRHLPRHRAAIETLEEVGQLLGADAGTIV